jgi:hypothetical protein
MPLTAIRHMRKMRGGSQAHLLQADDNNWYVVKFRNNPQNHRVLVNELLCATLLQYLQIASPKAAVIEVNDRFIEANPDLFLEAGKRIAEFRAILVFDKWVGNADGRQRVFHRRWCGANWKGKPGRDSWRA